MKSPISRLWSGAFLRKTAVVLCVLFGAVMLYDAGRDATSYYGQYAQWKSTSSLRNPLSALKPGQSLAPGLPPIHRNDVIDFPTSIRGLNTVQGSYKMTTDGFGANPDEYLHVDVLASPSDFDVVRLDDDDIPTQKPGGQALFLITPKRDGFLALSVRAVTYRIDRKANRRIMEGYRGLANLTVLVDEPLLSVPWFETHAFAKDLFFAVFPLLIGFFGGRSFEARNASK